MQTCNPGNYLECPTPNCDYFVAQENKNQESFECPVCEVTSCLKCGEATRHEGMSHAAWITKMKNEQREEEIKNAVAEIDPAVATWQK